MKISLKNIIETKLYKLPINEICTERKCIINTINAHSFCIAKNDFHFAASLKHSDVLLPDGISLVYAAKILNNLKPYLQEYLKDEFMPVISNVSTQAYTTKDEAIELLASQLTSPVKYKQSVSAHADKVDLFIEFGNGIVLKGLNNELES